MAINFLKFDKSLVIATTTVVSLWVYRMCRPQWHEWQIAGNISTRWGYDGAVTQHMVVGW